jgi:hypothetical protein
VPAGRTDPAGAPGPRHATPRMPTEPEAPSSPGNPPGESAQPAAAKTAATESDARDALLRMRAGGRIAGIAVNARTGEPMACKLEAIPRDARRAPARTTAGRSGRFELDGLEPGVFDVVARTTCRPPFLGILRGLQLGTGTGLEGVTVRLEPGGAIVLQVRDLRRPAEPDGRGRRSYGCHVEQHGLAVSSPSARHFSGAVIPVPAGRLRVCLADPDHEIRRLERVVDVTAGGEVEVVFTLE